MVYKCFYGLESYNRKEKNTNGDKKVNYKQNTVLTTCLPNSAIISSEAHIMNCIEFSSGTVSNWEGYETKII